MIFWSTSFRQLYRQHRLLALNGANKLEVHSASSHQHQCSNSNIIISLVETHSNTLRGTSKGLTVFLWLSAEVPWKYWGFVQEKKHKNLRRKNNNEFLDKKSVTKCISVITNPLAALMIKMLLSGGLFQTAKCLCLLHRLQSVPRIQKL